MIVERKRIFEILAEPNVEYDQVHIHVLQKDLPSLDEVFSMIQAEE